MNVLFVTEMPLEGDLISADLVADFPNTGAREFLEPFRFTTCQRRGRVLLVSELLGEFGGEGTISWKSTGSSVNTGDAATFTLFLL